MLLRTLQELILDAQTQPLFAGTSRHLQLTAVAGKATICIGVRRSGKSTLLVQRMQQLLAQGVTHENLLYLNFFDDRLYALKQQGLGMVTDAYYALYPAKKHSETVYCFFDEIQVMPQWEAFIERLLRTERCEVYITGSSAQMLSKEIATQMRGRALAWELFPFAFREYLDYCGITLGAQSVLSSKQRVQVQHAFEQYWHKGGFPEVLALEPRLRVKVHQEYFHAILFRDLVERHDIAHPKAVLDLAHWLLDNIASLYSLNKLTGYLKALGHKISPAAVADYMAWFEDAYFLFTVRLFDASLSRANANPKKVYCVDHALVTSVASGILVNAGHLLENLVFMALRRTSAEIFYYRTRNGHEVDFIVQQADRSRLLVQVCESLVNPATRKRELLALQEAMQELNSARGIIVSRYEEESILTPAGTIEVIPAWRFLLHPH